MLYFSGMHYYISAAFENCDIVDYRSRRHIPESIIKQAKFTVKCYSNNPDYAVYTTNFAIKSKLKSEPAKFICQSN